MAATKLQAVTQPQVNDQVVVAGQVRSAMQSAQRLTPAFLSLSRLPATLAGPNPQTESPDSFGNDPYGSRAGRSARHWGSRPIIRKPGACYVPAYAG